jgi:ADP-ribosyl-[dinitrogen reductase] hydrolase
MPSTEECLLGGLWGMLVGDACGVPYEFNPPDRLPPKADLEMTPPTSFARSHRQVPPGTYSDDGAQALCLLASLLDRGKLDADDLGKRLLAWYEDGYLAVDGVVFDVGIQTGQALRSLSQGTPALRAGPTADQANGNGSLMRVLPLALFHRGTDAELVDDAHAQSRVTHGHRRSLACCALYCLWARRVLASSPAPWDSAATALRELYEHHESMLGELEFHVRPDEPLGGQGSGYVVDCLRSARWACEQGAYEDAVKAAIGLGRDTDTTACVAGGIAGLRDGYAAIPERWRASMRGRELIEPLAARLVALRG